MSQTLEIWTIAQMRMAMNENVKKEEKNNKIKKLIFYDFIID